MATPATLTPTRDSDGTSALLFNPDLNQPFLIGSLSAERQLLCLTVPSLGSHHG